MIYGVTHSNLQRVETASYEAVYARHAANVLAAVTALTGSGADAEEIVQDAFLAAYVNWTRVGTLNRPDLWVRKVALNRARSKWRRMKAESRAVFSLVRTAQRAHASPLDQVVARHELAGLIASLPQRRREAVVLHFIDGLDYNETSAAMGCTPATVRAHVYQTRMLLQNPPANDGKD